MRNLWHLAWTPGGLHARQLNPVSLAVESRLRSNATRVVVGVEDVLTDSIPVGEVSQLTFPVPDGTPPPPEGYTRRDVYSIPTLSASSAEAEIIGERLAAHRAELGFPENWVDLPGDTSPTPEWPNGAPPQWDSSVCEGEPHPKILAMATVTRED